jgi:hypothetical protein
VKPHENPLVVQYLYVHGQDEDFFYPSTRSGNSAASVAVRYLECALVQAASLRLPGVDCELALATNITDPSALGRAGVEIMERLDALGVRIIPTTYRHRPGDDSSTYVSSRYVLDAIVTACEGQPDDRYLLLTDLDCVWPDAERLFTAMPAPPRIGCINIPYPADWDVVGFGHAGRSRTMIGQLAGTMGGPPDLPAWIGGELLTGTPLMLRALVRTCEQLDERLSGRDEVLPTEEQIFSLAGALGLIDFDDLASVAWRVHTGPRHQAPPVADPLSLGLWHLPGEKGLSLRRTAREVRRGRTGRLQRDLTEPVRMARRFNVAGTGLRRRVRDDSWIAARRVGRAVRGRLDVLSLRGLSPRT